MSDYKKNSKGMRFENGKPAEKRGKTNYGKPSYGDDRPDYNKKNNYNGKNGGYKKYDRDDTDYKKRDFDKKDGYKKRDFDKKDGYKKRDFDKKDGYKKRDFDKKDGYKKRDFDKKDDYKKRDFDKKDNYKKRNGGFDNDRHSYPDERNSGRENVEMPMREDELPFLIMGRNAVREALKSGRSIDKILVIPERDGSLGEILSMARDRNILIQEEHREKLDELCMPFGHGEKTGNHQGIVARVPGAEYVDLQDILAYAKERGENPFILLLDGITDPYNFGSIIRSAECAGVHGIIIPKRRSATLTSSAVKVSAGAASHMRIAKVPNIAGAIDKLHDMNIWVAGADMEGQPMYKTDMSGAMAIVIGSEDEGLSALVRKKCDFIISAPIKGHIDSLNAAVAAAVLMYEKVRQENS